MSKVLVLNLEGPLQSWGDRSRFLRRETLAFPTKSGVIGLLLCAMGLGGSQEKLLHELNHGQLEIWGYGPEARRASVLEDFHMVGSGYDDADPWDSLFIPKKSDGKKANGGPKITRREYLQDAKFAVFFNMPDEKAEEMQRALENPKWDLYLGRKSCTPSAPVFFGTFEDDELAKNAFLKFLSDRQDLGGPMKVFFKVKETSEDDAKGIALQDVPVQFGQIKQYEPRFVRIEHAE